MRENIDLTRDREFRDKINFIPWFKIPWRKLEMKIEVIDETKDFCLIVLGNKKERENTKETFRTMSDKFCDMCGRRIFPWDRVTLYRLCFKCNENLQSDERCIWRKKF